VTGRLTADSMPQYLAEFGMDMPPGLACLEVEPSIPADVYADRIRSVLTAALEILLADRLRDRVAQESLPAWFRAGDATSDAGRRNYEAHVGEPGWRLDDWLSRFDPDLDVRGWEWWDMTQPPGRDSVRVWVDPRGEVFFAHLDLLWLCYSAGAVSVSRPELVETPVWLGEPSVESPCGS
jgi:hypothetical protein